MIKELTYIILNYSIPQAYRNVFYNNNYATIVNVDKGAHTRKYYNYRELNKRRYYAIYDADGIYKYPLPQRYIYSKSNPAV